MKLSNIIIYVDDIPATVGFYKDAFGIDVGYKNETCGYVELDTGDTRISFITRKAADDIGLKFAPINLSDAPPGIEITFTVDDVDAAFKKAVAAGAISWVEPADMHWGQRISYVRCKHSGILIEIASHVSG